LTFFPFFAIIIPMKHLPEIFKFIDVIGQLKYTMRFGDIESDRKDSSAAHSWRLAVLCMILGPEVPDLDILRAVKIALVHDIPELLAGEEPFGEVLFDKSKISDKHLREADAARVIFAHLPEALCKEMLELYNDYSSAGTREAKFVKICDKLEAAYTTMNDVGLKKVGYGPPLHSKQCFGMMPEMDEAIRFVNQELKKAHDAESQEWFDEYNLPLGSGQGES